MLKLYLDGKITSEDLLHQMLKIENNISEFLLITKMDPKKIKKIDILLSTIKDESIHLVFTFGDIFTLILEILNKLIYKSNYQNSEINELEFRKNLLKVIKNFEQINELDKLIEKSQYDQNIWRKRRFFYMIFYQF